MHGPLHGAEREEFYQQGKVCGTTLQMPAEAWPESRDAFDEYWDSQVARIEISDEIRDFLLDIANFGYAPPKAIQDRYGPVKLRRTIGYLPEPFRKACGWSGPTKTRSGSTSTSASWSRPNARSHSGCRRSLFTFFCATSACVAGSAVRSSDAVRHTRAVCEER